MPTIASSLFPGRSLSCFHLECLTANSHIFCPIYDIKCIIILITRTIMRQVATYTVHAKYALVYCYIAAWHTVHLWSMHFRVFLLWYIMYTSSTTLKLIIACIFCCYRGLIWLKIMQTFNSIIIASPLYWYFEKIYRTDIPYSRKI